MNFTTPSQPLFRRRPRRRRSPLFWLFALAVAGGFSSVSQAIDLGANAPDFVLESKAQSKLALSSFRGKVVYLDFWASWCGPCRHTLPWMNDISKRYADRGLQVLAVNMDKDRAKALDAVSEVAPDLAVLFDAEGSVAKQYSLPSMPTSFLIDRSGAVRLIHPGFHDGDDAKLERAIVELLNR